MDGVTKIVIMLQILCAIRISEEVQAVEDGCQCKPGNCNETEIQYCYFENDTCTGANCLSPYPIYLEYIQLEPNGSFDDCSEGMVDPVMVCAECDASCAEGKCVGDTSNCTECSSDYKTIDVKGQIECETDCYSKQFEDVHNKCHRCDSVLAFCNDCKPDIFPVSESFWRRCNKSCNGGVTPPAANMSLRCDQCEDGYYLHQETEGDHDSCRCCVAECPEGFKAESTKCVSATADQTGGYCVDHNILCFKIFPAIAGGLGFVIVLVILVIVITVKCRKKSGKDMQRPVELPSKTFVDQVTMVQRESYHREDDVKSHEDETHSQDSATAIPLLEHRKKSNQQSSPKKPVLGVAANDAAVVDGISQEDYVNVTAAVKPPSEATCGGQEIYENAKPAVRESVAPKLPPRQGEEDETCDEYVNEEAITEFARNNPHLTPKGKQQQQQKAALAEGVPLPPSGQGHTHGKTHGYANQDVIEKFEGQQQQETQPAEYQNVQFPPTKPSSGGRNSPHPPKPTGSGGNLQPPKPHKPTAVSGRSPLLTKPKPAVGVGRSPSNKVNQQANGGLSDEVLAQAVPAPGAPGGQKEARDYYNMPGSTYYNKNF